MVQYLHWGSVYGERRLCLVLIREIDRSAARQQYTPGGAALLFLRKQICLNTSGKADKNMTIGPLEFVVIGCKGDRFTSEIVPELSSIQEKGLIRVVDLIFVRKDTDGTVKALEVHDLNDEELAAFDPIKEDLMRILTPQDISLLTEAIPPDTSADIVLLEHAWIVRLTEGLNKADDVLLSGGMVAHATIEPVLADFKTNQQ